MGRWRFAPPSKPFRTWSADSSTMPFAWRRSMVTPASVTLAKFNAASISASGRASARRAMAERIVERHERAPVLFPQVVGFRLQMALLTHPAYPLPIWTALQVRNRLVRHVHVDPGEKLDLW